MAEGRTSPRPSVVLSHLSVEFSGAHGGHRLAVNDVSLQVEPGELVVLVGPSGCGKTTILNVIADLQRPSGGDVTVFGKSPQRARGEIGYMFATDCLFPWRTVQRNIELSFDMRKTHVSKKERRARSAELLEELGLSHTAQQFPRQLSHGMRQRAALARTWAQDPELLLMDEPFAALDAQTRTQVQSVFIESWSRHRKTVMFVTHDLDEAILMADRIVVITEGIVREIITVPFPRPRRHQELWADVKYNEMRTHLLTLLNREAEPSASDVPGRQEGGKP